MHTPGQRQAHQKGRNEQPAQALGRRQRVRGHEEQRAHQVGQRQPPAPGLERLAQRVERIATKERLFADRREDRRTDQEQRLPDIIALEQRVLGSLVLFDSNRPEQIAQERVASQHRHSQPHPEQRQPQRRMGLKADRGQLAAAQHGHAQHRHADQDRVLDQQHHERTTGAQQAVDRLLILRQAFEARPVHQIDQPLLRSPDDNIRACGEADQHGQNDDDQQIDPEDAPQRPEPAWRRMVDRGVLRIELRHQAGAPSPISRP